MNIGIACVPVIAAEVDDLRKICGDAGIRKAVPLVRDDMVDKLKTAESLAAVASAQEVTLNSWKEVESDIGLKRNRVRSLLNHWTSMQQIIKGLREQDGERIIRYVIAHQMQSKCSVIPDGTVLLDIGAGVYVEFTYDEAVERLTKVTKEVEQSSDRLQEYFEECKKNIVTSEVNISQLHNYGVEFRDVLAKATKAPPTYKV